MAIVDPGMPGPNSADALDQRLAAAGFEPRHVHTVIVTHSHIDHFGGTTRFARAGARVVTHESFQNWFDLGGEEELEVADADDSEIEDDPSELVDRIVEFAPVAPWSNEPWQPDLIDPERVRMALEYDRDFFTLPSPTKRLADADVIELGGREWVAVSTPGHTPDHLCLLDPASGTLLAGDHVLPTITPHLAGMGAGEDPLTEYFESLERMHHLGEVQVALPAARASVHRRRGPGRRHPRPPPGAAGRPAHAARRARPRDGDRAVAPALQAGVLGRDGRERDVRAPRAPPPRRRRPP